MHIDVQGHAAYCYTAGKRFDPARPTVVFIHGVLNDHSVWILQSRYYANHGWNVLAVDLPGHCRSAGEAPASVEAAADFIIALLQAVGQSHGVAAPRAALVGHSWGSLIALEAAARAPQLVRQLVLVGTAWPMKVSPALLEASLNEPERALRMINVFSRATLAPPPSAFGPGTWVFGGSMALGRRVLASNRQVNVFHRGFKACDSYANGETAMGQVARAGVPTLFVLGSQDQMTQPAQARTLISTAQAAGGDVHVVQLPTGHHQMNETPEEMLGALKGFLKA